MGPLKLKNMKKIVDLLKTFVAILIVMLGAYFTNFYLSNKISFTSVFIGIIGFFILFPAIKKWEETIWGKKDSDVNQS